MKYRFSPREWAAAAMMLVEDPANTALADLTIVCTLAMSPGVKQDELDFRSASEEITGKVVHLSNTDLTLHFGFLCLRLAEEFYSEDKLQDVPGRTDIFNKYAAEIRGRLEYARIIG